MFRYRRQAARGANGLVRGGLRLARRVATGAVAGASYRAIRRTTRRVVKKGYSVRRKPMKFLGRTYNVPVIQSDPSSVGNELTRAKSTYGKYPKLRPSRLLKLVKAGMNDIVIRAQGITNFDTNVGFYPLANRGDTTTGAVQCPMHVWDLTAFANRNDAPPPVHAIGWTNATSGATCTRTALTVQLPDGSTGSTRWVVEDQSGTAESSGTNPNSARIYHEWTDIRMNLYAARKRGTTFYIDIVRIKDENANLLNNVITTNTSSKAYVDLVKSLTAPLIYSNLQTYKPTAQKCIQRIKSYRFYVPGGSADDLDTVGKIKEFKLFLKHGNVYDMRWDALDNAEGAIPHAQEDGVDYTDRRGIQNTPHNTSRVYMILRAFSPERRELPTASWPSSASGITNAGVTMGAADPLSEPSYDMLIRNKYSVPN